jgi:hypothetical protein
MRGASEFVEGSCSGSQASGSVSSSVSATSQIIKKSSGIVF